MLAQDPSGVPGAQRSRGLALDRRQLARSIASLAGALAFIFFYQPWVAASLPGASEGALTGVELARGVAGARADAGRLAGTGIEAPGAGGLVLPTRIATPVDSAGAGAGAGGLVLPTRQPAGVEAATAAAATVMAVQTTQAGGSRAPSAAATTTTAEPDRLPVGALFGVPLAAAGVAIFSAIWGRLSESRDRLYGQIWTVLLSLGGTFGAGYVLWQVATTPRPNDLLAPGEALGALWGLWATFLAFLLSAISLAAAWIQPRRTA